jgi:hypothetical protein
MSETIQLLEIVVEGGVQLESLIRERLTANSACPLKSGRCSVLGYRRRCDGR